MHPLSPHARRVYPVPRDVPLEVSAYALAKFSRSADALEDTIRDLHQRRATRFFDEYYFGYGHKSIADLAHIGLAVENVSLLAAMRCLDESLWDGQERSTRYQPFEEDAYYVPPTGLTVDNLALYHKTMKGAFAAYRGLADGLYHAAAAVYPIPEGMDTNQYTRTLKARVFDVARYALPLGTLTSFGQVTSARTLEAQITRLMSDELHECFDIGTDMKLAAKADLPTLVKYANANLYAVDHWHVLRVMAAHLESSSRSENIWRNGRKVNLSSGVNPNVDIPATALWVGDTRGRDYDHLVGQVLVARHKDQDYTENVLEMLTTVRGEYDPLPRIFRSGYWFTFEIMCDIGAMRDLNRHRRCVKFIRPPTGQDGMANLVTAVRDGLGPEVAYRMPYSKYMEDAILAQTDAQIAYDRLRDVIGQDALYVMPLATNTRMLIKMDFAELEYISKLRSKPGGHFSYRQVAWQMAEELTTQYPDLRRVVEAVEPEPMAAEIIFNR